jgi:GNAT superfamily N-acetyltransferase
MMIIRPLAHTAAEYAALAAVRNAVWSDEAVTAAQLQHEDRTWLPGYLFQRLVVDVEGCIVAAAHYFENHWQYQPGKYDFDLVVHPAWQGRGIGTAVYNHVLNQLATRQPHLTSLVSSTREDQPQAIRFLEQRGFQPILRWARTQLAVADFDPTPFVGATQRLAEEDIHIYSLQELQRMDAAWQRRAFDLDQIAAADAPSADPMSAVAFETYVENTFHHPGFLAEGCFAAVKPTGEWVGLTELSRTEDADRLNTPWTAVHPAYRRRGVATALKTKAIAYAKMVGARVIIASNAEQNPMYRINLALGFQPLPAALTMKKSISGA